MWGMVSGYQHLGQSNGEARMRKIVAKRKLTRLRLSAVER